MSTLIFLNGTSSSGKTSVAKALQATLRDPYLYFSADVRKPMLPAYREGLGWKVDEILDRLREGYYRCLAAMVAAGNFVIADQAVERAEWIAQCAQALGGARAYLVGVRCPLEVAERRESERGDRTIGLVREQFDVVHLHGVYDVEVDTSAHSPEECAAAIQAHIESYEPRAFAILRERVRERTAPPSP